MQPCKFYHGVAAGREVQHKQDKITWMSGGWVSGGGGGGGARSHSEGGWRVSAVSVVD